MSENNHHHYKHRSKFKKWFDNNKRFVIAIIILLIFLLAYFIDSRSKNIYSIPEDVYVVEEANKNYDAIITVVDGEGEKTFTEVWGVLIKEGYPICSDLVTDYIGRDGFMDWDTIKALDDIGVEFVFHSSKHQSYNSMTNKEILDDIRGGIKAMEDHGLEHRSICWLTSTTEDRCELGKEYFDVGITDHPAISTLEGDKSNPMMVADIFGSNDETYFTFEQLLQLIEQARLNNGWLVLFTRNNHKMMDSTQIDIYRQAFEYAKEHNVAVVTASEGFDLYYGNKLGNH